MKKQIFYTGIILFAIGIAINSCSKSKSSNITPTETNLPGTYKFSSETAKPGTGAVINVFDSVQACQTDDEVRFNADSTYDYLDQGIVCTPAGNYTGSWYLQSSNIFVLDFTNYTIKSFNNKTLVLVYDDDTGSPVVVYTFTFVKQ